MPVGLTARKKLSVGLKKPARIPHEYQKLGVEWNVSHGGAANFLRPGRGKTAIILRSILALKQAGVLAHALVVAPLRVAYNVWPAEAAEWEGSEWEGIKDLKIRILHGPKKDLEAQQDADVYVINFDGLKWLFEDGLYKRFRAMNIDTLVWDESTKIKHTKTKRFKLLKPTLKWFARRWILTGGPVPRSYLDLFGQIYVVDLGRALGQYITHYRMEYFTPLDRNGWTWGLKPGSEKRIQKAIAPYVFQPEDSDMVEPELIDNVIRVNLPPEARKIYDEMEEQLIVQLDKDTTVFSVSSGVAAGKCSQIANGGLYHMRDETTEAKNWGRKQWTDLHTAKIEAIEEILGELNGRPAMIVYEYEHDLARLTKAFGFPHIGGGVSAKEGLALENAWNNDELTGLLVQPQAMAHGLNLQKGSAQDIIWHSLTHDYELFDQLIKRLLRQGSRHKWIYNHLIVARDTTDEAKLRNLRRKGRVQKDFLASLREYAEEKRR